MSKYGDKRSQSNQSMDKVDQDLEQTIINLQKKIERKQKRHEWEMKLVKKKAEEDAIQYINKTTTQIS